MILDQLENWALYFDQNSRVGRALHFLARDFDPATPDGKFAIEGDDCYAMVQSYETKDPSEGRFEAHRKYLDIQLMLEGAEAMGWSPLPDLEIEEEYDEERDVLFCKTPQIRTRLEVFAGSFAIFYPHDAHAPGLKIDSAAMIKKVVVKVRV